MLALRGRRPTLLVSFAALAAACGGGDEAPPETFEEACAQVDGCQTPAMRFDGPTEPVWRVLVVRDGAGDVRIEQVEEFETPVSIGPPQGPLSGAHGLAALDDSGAPLEVQRLSFPETLLIEGDLEVREEVDYSGREVSAIGYLRVSEDVGTLAVVEPDGSVLFSLDAPAPGEAVREDGDVGGAREELVQAAPGSACGHVMLIELAEGDEVWFPGSLAEEFPLHRPTPLQRAVVQAALGRLTPMHCAGVGRIAFVTLNPRTGGMVRSVRGGYLGDVVMINADLNLDGLGFDDHSLSRDDQRALLTHTTIHEAAHATTYLLNGTAGLSLFAGDWAPSERALAEETIDRVRLRAGFSPEWKRAHGSFANLGWAGPYVGSVEDGEAYVNELKGQAPQDLAARGFMSAYAGVNELEDIAEVATWPHVGADYRDAGVPEGPAPMTNDFGCVAMRAHGEPNVPQDLAAVFTKLSFLRDLGVVPEDLYDRCTGDSTGLPREHRGIAIYEEDSLQRVFDDSPQAVIGTLGERYVFEMTVDGDADFDGETYPATLTMRIDLGPTSNAEGEIPVHKIPWPRGVYPLTAGTPHEFMLRLDGKPAGDFDVTDGFVLFAESSNDRLLGSVFARQAFRPHAPVPVPPVFDPPLQFRFLMSSGG